MLFGFPEGRQLPPLLGELVWRWGYGYAAFNLGML
jgi:hypothetical protein